MKLASVKYNLENSHWFSTEYFPDNPRSILLYTLEGGEAEGKYVDGKWIQYRWNCEVNPIAWREMPRWKQQ